MNRGADMSFNIHNANANSNTTSGYSAERAFSDNSGLGQTKSSEIVNQINSLKALTKVEMSGVKVTTGDKDW